jgi:hypothetical protein
LFAENRRRILEESVSGIILNMALGIAADRALVARILMPHNAGNGYLVGCSAVAHLHLGWGRL